VFSSNDILIQLLMLDAGIVPFTLNPGRSSSGPDLYEMQVIDKRIATMATQDRRLVKRKFRKLWRKAVRVWTDTWATQNGIPLTPGSVRDIAIQSTYGLKCGNPTPRQKCARRAVVMWFLKKEVSEATAN
jgi:hypothetical protein